MYKIKWLLLLEGQYSQKSQAEFPGTQNVLRYCLPLPTEMHYVMKIVTLLRKSEIVTLFK